MPAAARFLDLTNHPGLIVKGSPTVLINGFPAARQTDTHACLLPPLVGPHPSNAISAGSKTVLINGLPAARQLDLAGCGASISTGSPTVLIGG
ncbi:MAG TPA: PAAR domain-containing protein [Micropepsaceae bacterium]|jgi:uncharacterized Zn-binding protein involved in type VI secretion